MKRKIRLSLCIFIAFPFSLFAQDWQCVRDGVTATFVDTSILNQNTQHTAWVVHIDSVRVHQGWNYHYGFHKIRQISDINNYPNGYESCYDAYGPSRMGVAMSALGGENFFFNSDNQGIRISALQQPGQSWICCGISDTSMLFATVTSVGFEPVLGVADSVKYISFQAKSNSGVLLPHPMNTHVFKLSKHFGMITLFDFYSFPQYIDNSPVHFLAGISSSGITNGDQNLMYKEIYSFSPGDEFHTDYVADKGPHWGGSQTKTINKVLSAFWNSTHDTVIYQVSRLVDDWSGWYDLPHYYTLDTILRSYSFSSKFSFGLDYFPEQSVFSFDTTGQLKTVNSFIQYRGNDYNTRRVKQQGDGHSPISFCSDTLVGSHQSYWGNTSSEYKYIDGCGGPYYHFGSSDFYHDYYETFLRLVYFKKGSETWGKPWDTAGWMLPNATPDLQQFKVNIYPNPAFGQVNIEIPDAEKPDYRLVIFSLSGIKISEMKITESKFTFNISDYQTGMYFLKLYKGNLQVGQQKLIKK
jgi:hypothetical protein